MAELLVELLSEEIPARMQAPAAAELARLLADRLAKAGLAFAEPRTFSTPRRIAVAVDGLPLRQPDSREEKRGPRADAPEAAVQGFLRANGLTLDRCERRETARGVFWFAVVERPGRAAAEVLPECLAEAVAALAWPKSMRWGAGRARWVRPLERGLCVFDGAPLPFALPGGASAGGTTTGHRFMAPEPFAPSSAADYLDRLRAARVAADPAERRRMVADGAAALAAAEGLRVEDDPRLLDEVAGLVEWPVPLLGRIDSAFMEAPEEVLAAAMRAHQRYFPLRGPDGALAPRFVVVANVEAPDGGAAVVAGNERVLRARLADARFFWDQDRKRPLADRVADLASTVFHDRLGTLADKAARLERLSGEIAAAVPGADAGQARRAGLLAKADLTTGMVGEFPDLQGRMGGHYARHDGEDEDVALAVSEHYAPRGPDDACPRRPVGVALALADKLDTLVGLFAAGARPTGSGDPYALRRAALGVLRLVLENGVRLGLRAAVRAAWRGWEETAPGFPPGAPEGEGGRAELEELETELAAFFADRLKAHLRAQGVRHDLVSAAFAPGGEDDMVRLRARAAALEGFLAAEDGANLLTAYRRATNIVAIEARKDGGGRAGPPDPALFGAPEERALHARLEEVRRDAAPLLDAERFDDAMRALAGLRGPVDDFFDRVTVNAGDPALRENRLKLLGAVRETMNAAADFSRIEG